MTTQSQETEYINVLREDSKLFAAMTRLQSNADFKLIINDLFLTKDCSSILKNSISNRNLSKQDKKFSINLAKSAGYFSYWFNTMYDKLNSADKEYKEYCSNPEDFFDKNSTTEGTINVFRN